MRRYGWLGCLCLLGMAQADLIIDDFREGGSPTLTANVSMPSSNAARSGASGGILNGAMTLQLQWLGGNFVQASVSNSIGDITTAFSSAGGQLDLRYGTAGLDLDLNAAGDQFELVYSLLEHPAGTYLHIQVDDGVNQSAADVVFGGSPSLPVLVPFSDFTPVLATPADFGSIDRINFQYVQPQADGTFQTVLETIQVSMGAPAVPEPGSCLLFGLAGLGFAGWRRRQRRAAAGQDRQTSICG